MKQLILSSIIIICATLSANAQSKKMPWDNGRLVVSEEGRYLKHENGTPFFWLGETAWLLPQRTTRDEVDFYLAQVAQKGYNVVQIQTLNNVPSWTVYGQPSMHDGFNFKNINKKDVYGYWDHMDYIVKTAEQRGIYIAMVCIWGTPVADGKMNVKEAQAYGKFLAERYKASPNIIWFIGGDIRGDVKTDVWQALAQSIRTIDSYHLMSYHPRGRTMSGTWFHNESWMDFNQFQSGHRRYGQRKGDGDYPIEENTEEDNWRFVERSFALKPLKPVIDSEPIYEDIPHGLHDKNEARWNDNDMRRYAYWSVFAGSFGHTYGHNSIMQFYKPGVQGSFFPGKYWYDCMDEPGLNQMVHLKKLILAFPYFERVPDQTLIHNNGERYDRAVATRGNDYMLVYNYSGRPMKLDLTKISGARKKCWWFNPRNGALEYIGEFESNGAQAFQADVAYMAGNDRVLIAIDSSKEYIKISDTYIK